MYPAPDPAIQLLIGSATCWTERDASWNTAQTWSARTSLRSLTCKVAHENNTSMKSSPTGCSKTSIPGNSIFRHSSCNEWLWMNKCCIGLSTEASNTCESVREMDGFSLSPAKQSFLATMPMASLADLDMTPIAIRNRWLWKSKQHLKWLKYKHKHIIQALKGRLQSSWEQLGLYFQIWLRKYV